MTSLPPLSQDLDPQYRSIGKKMDVLRHRNRFGPKIEAPYLIGLSYNPFDKEFVYLVNISLSTGYPNQINGYNLMVIEAGMKSHSSPKQKRHRTTTLPDKANYIYDGVGTMNVIGNYVGLLHTGSPDDVNDILIEFDLIRDGRDVETLTVKGTDAPINAVLEYSNGLYYTFTIKEGADKGNNKHLTFKNTILSVFFNFIFLQEFFIPIYKKH